jgi:hypothetical protein
MSVGSSSGMYIVSVTRGGTKSKEDNTERCDSGGRVIFEECMCNALKTTRAIQELVKCTLQGLTKASYVEKATLAVESYGWGRNWNALLFQHIKLRYSNIHWEQQGFFFFYGIERCVL